MAEPEVRLIVTRYRPGDDQAPTSQTYTVPYQEDWVVLDALQYIKDRIDGTLSFRWSCHMGICGSCGMTVNGEPKLTCSVFLRDYSPREIRVGPLANFPIIRDLVVDIDDFMDKLRNIKPYIIRQDLETAPVGAGQEFRQLPEQVEDFQQPSMCINCMLCYAACPVYGMDSRFLGPAAIALARRYNMDSRDQGRHERMPFVANAHGIWECTAVGECTVVCPKHVDPNAQIQREKVGAAKDFWASLLRP
jgi:fumarate reductase iron-sulfur subunit